MYFTEPIAGRAVGIGRCHGKVIPIGEHTVVYGLPAIALPLSELTVSAAACWSTQSTTSACAAHYS